MTLTYVDGLWSNSSQRPLDLPSLRHILHSLLFRRLSFLSLRTMPLHVFNWDLNLSNIILTVFNWKIITSEVVPERLDSRPDIVLW